MWLICTLSVAPKYDDNMYGNILTESVYLENSIQAIKQIL